MNPSMNKHTKARKAFWVASLIGLLATSACAGGSEMDRGTEPASREALLGWLVDRFGSAEEEPGPDDPEALPPFVGGDNDCFMIQAYFPREALQEMLPPGLTIPDASVMEASFPDVAFRAESHPFMLSFCHGSNIHDVLTRLDVPVQEEIMFVFPVEYTDDAGHAHLCSYVPVLYLDSLVGVLGGLFFGLRKEWHAYLQHGQEDDGNRWWSISELVDASFELQPGDEAARLPHFMEQTFANPFVTLSYPQPVPRLLFYQARIYPDAVRRASAAFYWHYRGTTISEHEGTSSVQADYHFTMSLPETGSKYFK
jgi:hypothetical protein